MAQGVDDDHVGMAFEIGNSLGVGVELKPLVQRMAVLGREGRSGVQAVGLQELIAWTARRREHLEEVWKKLRRGEIPNHIALGVLRIELASAFHRVPLLNSARTDGTSVGPVNQRFGGRISSSLPAISGTRWRLNADITAILSATHFGLLTRVEKEFAPIRIPQNTVVALTGMQNALRPSQPHRVDATRRILIAVSGGHIEKVELDPISDRHEADGDMADDILRLLRYAMANESLVLDFLPVRSIDPMRHADSIPIQYSSRLRDAHSVVDALALCGALSGPERAKAVDELGTRDGIPADTVIPAGSRILCRSAVLELLSLAGVLDVAVAVFKLAIPSDELHQEQIEIDNAAIAETDAEWVGDLISHVRDGLSTGVYEILPQMPRAKEPSIEGGHEPSPAETVLLDLLQFPGGESDLIWIDDRWATSLEHRDSIRIVGTVDLLMWMKESGTISVADVDNTLMEMRAADVRFIAFDSDELLRAILDAQIGNGKLVETKPLRVFRQYYARCLLEADVLRPPPTPGVNVATEWNFLLGCWLAVTTALIQVWETTSIDHAAARAEWLLRNMYTDDRGIHGTAAPRTEADDAHRAAVSLVGLITSSIRLDGSRAHRRARRQYLRWLYRRLVRTRFAADGELRRAAIDQLKRTITQGLEKDDEALQVVATRLMGRLCSDLPQEIRKLTDTDQEFLRTIGISMKSVTEIGPLRFERRPTWTVLAQTLRDRTPAEFTTLDGHLVKVVFVEGQPPVFSVKCDALEFDGHVGGDEFAFLSESLTEREASAKRLMHWFDVPRERREELVARIVGGQDPGTRIDLALEARGMSGEALYRRVFESLKVGETFNPTDAMPSGSAVLIDHLRLDLSDAPSSRWARSAQRLLLDVGIVEAVTRLGGLPVPLSDAVVESLSALPLRDRRRALRAIRKILLASPVGLVQLAQLWGRLPHVARHAGHVCNRLTRVLCDENRRPVFDAWLATLQWIDEQFGFDESFRTLPTDIRLGLVWTHGDRLFRLLLSRGLPPDWIQGAFERTDYALPAHLIFPDAAFTEDIAAPRRLRAESFILAGLALIHGHQRATAGMESLASVIEQMNDEDRARVLGAMLTDTSSTTDLLGSWLANTTDRLELFPTELREHFGPEAVVARLHDALAGIAAKVDEKRNWLTVVATVGDYPPSEAFRNELQATLPNISLADYLNRDPMLAVAALGAIAPQARYLSSERRATIETQLLELARQIGDASLEESVRDTLSNSILAAITGCTWWQPDAGARAVALARALERLAEGSSPVFTESGSFILRLCDALPVTQARYFWRVRELLRCRTQL